MKRITRVVACLATVKVAAVVAAMNLAPGELERLVSELTQSAQRAAGNLATNPSPVLFALATFIVTARIRKARTLPPEAIPEVKESAVVRRALARATRTQLIADQILLENRTRTLPDAIRKAEKDVSYTENALFEAELALETKQFAHYDAVDQLDTLRREQAATTAEVTAIKVELAKFAEAI